MDEIAYERRGALAVIRLERPQALNALTLPMIGEIERLARAAERDPEVVAICITGSGRGFCAGIDMSVLQASASAGAAPSAGRERPDNPALFSFLTRISKPVIAAVNGVAAGGGFVLAMMCDLRFMAEDASLTTVFGKRGLIAEHGTSWLLPRIIGLSRALDVLWSSRRLDAAEAWRLGLADRVIAPAGLVEAVEAYVADIASHTSPRALAMMKLQVLKHYETGFDAAARESDEMMGVALAHPDATEGAMSFIERRPPRFKPWTGEDWLDQDGTGDGA